MHPVQSFNLSKDREMRKLLCLLPRNCCEAKEKEGSEILSGRSIEKTTGDDYLNVCYK
jgi:hypothetical protein